MTDNAALVYNLYGPQTTISAYAIGGSGSVASLGPGLLILSKSNGYTGGTYLGGGTLQLGNVNALGSGGLTVNAGALNLNANSPTVAYLSGAGGLITDYSSGAGTTTLVVSQTSTTTYSGTLANGATKVLALSFNQPGMLTLPGATPIPARPTSAAGPWPSTARWPAATWPWARRPPWPAAD